MLKTRLLSIETLLEVLLSASTMNCESCYAHINSTPPRLIEHQ